MLPARSVVVAVSFLTMPWALNLTLAQNFPTKPIRIVTSAAGGSGDTASRLIAPGFSAVLGQPVIVDNRGGFLTREIVIKAPPDGYTLLVDGAAFWIAPLLEKTSYDPIKDFLPVSLLISQPNLVVVIPSLPVKSIKELIVLAKAQPGTLNYFSTSTGGTSHLATELFKTMTGTNMVRIIYKGNPEGFNAMMSGEVHLAFASGSTAKPHVNGGRLRALAVTSAEPSALFPGLPTVANTVPGYESGSASVLLAPAKTPQAIIKRLNQEVVRALNRPDVKEKFFNTGSDVISSSPEELAAAMKADMARIGKVIKDAGIRLQ